MDKPLGTLRPARTERYQRDPRCRGKCFGPEHDIGHGIMSVARDSALESPAVFTAGHLPDGRRVIVCDCCQGLLARASRSDYSANDAVARFGFDAVPEDVVVYGCPRCEYTVHVARRIKAKDDQ